MPISTTHTIFIYIIHYTLGNIVKITYCIKAIDYTYLHIHIDIIEEELGLLNTMISFN